MGFVTLLGTVASLFVCGLGPGEFSYRKLTDIYLSPLSLRRRSLKSS